VIKLDGVEERAEQLVTLGSVDSMETLLLHEKRETRYGAQETDGFHVPQSTFC